MKEFLVELLVGKPAWALIGVSSLAERMAWKLFHLAHVLCKDD